MYTSLRAQTGELRFPLFARNGLVSLAISLKEESSISFFVAMKWGTEAAQLLSYFCPDQ